MPRIGSLQCAAVTVAIIGSVVLPPASAQQEQTAGIVTFDLFGAGSSIELNPDEARKLLDAARQARVPGDCPLGRITIFMPEGDPMFQQGTGRARRDVVLHFLDLNGIDASRFFADVLVFGGENTGNDAQLQYTPPDRELPKLNVTSTPEKGKKVTAGQRITVKAIARDDADRWQTGIKSIDLAAEGGGLFGFQDYPLTCDRPPPPRTLQGVYTVPANPPPLVRLGAIAKDFAGKEVELWADFPTGDWYGSLKLDAITPFYSNHARLGITLDYDGQGNLTGHMAGEVSAAVSSGVECAFSVTNSAKLSADLVGQYTPGTNTMSLRLTNRNFVKGGWICPPAPTGGEYGGGLIDLPMIEELLRGLTTKPDGSVEAAREDTSVPQNKVRARLKLRRAQN